MTSAGQFRGPGRKVKLWIPPEMTVEMEAEAARMGVKVSRLVRMSWHLARKRLMAAPTFRDRIPGG